MQPCHATRCVPTMLALSVLACAAPTGTPSGEAMELDLTGPKGDEGGPTEVQVLRPGRLTWQSEAIPLAPGERIGLSFRATRSLAFRVRAHQVEDTYVRHLRMQVLEGAERDGSDATDVRGVGLFEHGTPWQDPEVRISRPKDGVHYFFVVTNTADELRTVVLGSESPFSKHYEIDAPLGPGETSCGTVLPYYPRSGWVLSGLEPGERYTLAATGAVDDIEVFAFDHEADATGTGHPFDGFGWPELPEAPLTVVAEGPERVSFVAEAGRSYAAGITVPGIYNPLTGPIANAALCPGEVECVPACD